MEERFDLDFHILTPGGRDEHIMRVVDGQVIVVPPAPRSTTMEAQPVTEIPA